MRIPMPVLLALLFFFFLSLLLSPLSF